MLRACLQTLGEDPWMGFPIDRSTLVGWRMKRKSGQSWKGYEMQIVSP